MPTHENTLPKQHSDDARSKKIPHYRQERPRQVADQGQTEKYIALITLAVVVATTLVHLTSIVCKKFEKIERQGDEIIAQSDRIRNLERTTKLKQNEVDQVLAFLVANIDDLQKKLDGDVEHKNPNIYS